MAFDKVMIVEKLRGWEQHFSEYRLPTWSEIPDFGIYMEQVLTFLNQHLGFMPPDIRDEPLITAATINNYVRKRIMPEPVKKKYYREHLVYLILICSLKHCLTITSLQPMIPLSLTEDELHSLYDSYVVRHRTAVKFFSEQVRLAATSILDPSKSLSPLATDDIPEFIISAAVLGGFSRFLAEKLLMLDDGSGDKPKQDEQ